jgi:hypothetical protein
MTSKEDNGLNENVISKFFTLLERIENRYKEDYNYELNEGLIHRPSDEIIMNFLRELGLNINESPTDMENTENAI